VHNHFKLGVVMQLDGFVQSRAPIIPEMLRGKLTMIANYALDDTDVRLFGLALKAVELQLQKDGIPKTDLTVVNVVFTRDGCFSISESSMITYGFHFSLAVYALESLKKTNDARFILTTFIEELAHHYWRIEDETAVKYKVVEIASNVTPDITIDYLKGCGVNGL